MSSTYCQFITSLQRGLEVMLADVNTDVGVLFCLFVAFRQSKLPFLNAYFKKNNK